MWTIDKMKTYTEITEDEFMCFMGDLIAAFLEENWKDMQFILSTHKININEITKALSENKEFLLGKYVATYNIFNKFFDMRGLKDYNE